MFRIMKFATIVLYLCGLMMCLTQAQRPSYAGRRPPDGLTQKDKYYLDSVQNFNALQNSNSQANDFQKRFGNVATNNVETAKIAYGQAQRPPVGLPVVVAEPVRLSTLSQPFSFGTAQRIGNDNSNSDNDETSFGLRFGQNDSNVANGNVSSTDNLVNSSAASSNLVPADSNNTNNVTQIFPVVASAPVAAGLPVTTTTTTPQPIPLDALGDRLLVDQLNRLPVDKRPFWFLNYQAIEAQRNSSTPNVPLSQSRPFFAGR